MRNYFHHHAFNLPLPFKEKKQNYLIQKKLNKEKNINSSFMHYY